MSYRGRFSLGDEPAFGLITRNGSGVPTLPDAVPLCEVYGPSGKVISGKAVSILDPYASTGLFQMRLFLGPLFSVGQHTIFYRWTTGSGAFLGGDTDTFEVAPGGDIKGDVLALYYVDRPLAKYLIQQLSSGRLVANRGPRT